MAAGFEKYVRWSGKRKAILWCSVVVLVAAAYYFAGFAPMQRDMAKLNKDSAKLSEQALEKQAIAANLDEVKRAFEKMDQMLVEALKKLPTEEEIPKLLKTVSDLAKETGLESVLFKPGPAKPVPPEHFYASIPLQMEERGSFYDLARFFDKVSRLPRIVTVNDIKVTTDGYDPDGHPKLKAEYQATTFKYLPPEKRPKPEGKKGRNKKRKGKR